MRSLRECSSLLLFSNRSDIPTKDKITEFLLGFPDNISGYLSSQIKNILLPSSPYYYNKLLSKSDACQRCCKHYRHIISKIKQITCAFILRDHKKLFNLHKSCLIKQTDYCSREERPNLTFITIFLQFSTRLSSGHTNNQG